MNRVLSAARLHLAHPLVVLGVPWMIASIAFATNLAIWGLADLDAQAGEDNTGGLASLYITMIVVFVQTVTQVFPFAMGLSLSRRTYYAGTALAALAQSLLFGIALTALTAIENATGGWGVGLDFWAPGPIDVGNPALQLLVFTVPLVAACFLGIGIGVVFKRWGANGIYALSAVGLLAVGLTVVLVTWREAWADVWTWLSDRSVESMTLGLPALLTLALAVATYIGLRRTVP
ncbi:hypothetical protein O2W14_19575 [Modestobacter sp. VKM Ac-2986]|uniref:hypothetical protein n=1 Tax=Modestobacter sp. VKM Ac-2986 TaxID=3004140 RepID=UPI0022AB62F5|nr:hypothetical protein [Modestobacter sp. VKM Ac-2986]MCZ2831049.1 hypothetical protein [Modestobacter sp. VKM Ac-2986]